MRGGNTTHNSLKDRNDGSVIEALLLIVMIEKKL
jgi:hypothetical protein